MTHKKIQVVLSNVKLLMMTEKMSCSHINFHAAIMFFNQLRPEYYTLFSYIPDYTDNIIIRQL